MVQLRFGAIIAASMSTAVRTAAYSLSGVPLRRVNAGQLVAGEAPIEAGSLWQERGAVVFVVRRPG